MKKLISRRNMLRGAGVAMCLPWMESLAPRPARAQAVDSTPKRYVVIYMPGGSGIEWWDITGSGKGTNWQLSTLLQPFAPLKEKMLLIKNLGNYTWRKDLLTMSGPWDTYQVRADINTLMPYGAYILPSHSRDPSALFNCVDGDEFRKAAGVDVTGSPLNKVTVDQLIASSMEALPIPSMQLGLVNGQGEFDGRHSALSQNMSWSDTGTPLGKELDPQTVFDRLVSAGATQQDSTTDPAAVEAAARRKALDQSVLDSVQDSATTLQQRLASADKARLDDFLTGIRAIETSINQATRPPSTAGCTPIAAPGAITDMNLKSQAMNQLITMALQCDVTRVVSYMLDNSRSDMEYNWLQLRDFNQGGVEVGGTAGGYHGSQHAGLRNNTFATICNWHIGNVADLAMKMDAIQEGDGTLLDHSVVLFTSDMHHGDHASWDLPTVLLGGGNGTFHRDEYVLLEEMPTNSRQMRDLHYTIMTQYFGMTVPSIGDDMRPDFANNALIEEILT